MFNGLISKSYIVDNITIFIPHKIIDVKKLILISHGSGGIGEAEKHTAKFFIEQGYKVGIIDYFRPYNIKKLWWNYEEKFLDLHDTTFDNMLRLTHSFNEEIIHIGFSLGGFYGIQNSEKFLLNFCFYPGIFCFTNNHIEKDYSNTTVFTAGQDTWCNNYQSFSSLCKVPPAEIKIENAHHGFMIPDKHNKFTVAKYNFPVLPISLENFKSLKPNHYYLTEKFGYTPADIWLKYDKESCIMSLRHIKDRIKSL